MATDVLLSRLGRLLRLEQLLGSALAGIVVDASETFLNEEKSDVLTIEEEL